MQLFWLHFFGKDSLKGLKIRLIIKQNAKKNIRRKAWDF
ncbi:hypothetical protein FIC_00790 [Flavobacteriaceae bacterium 3519-10]|nr:hypothetical protein FIC_00790 [Flavobacteriaceae bacterium 3519-10]